MTQALLIVDIQNDYFPGGTMALEGAEAAGANAARLLADFRAKKLPVIHIQHLAARPGATFFLPGTPGAEIHPCVAPLPTETIIQKHYPNSFRQTGLEEHLKKHAIAELVICGMMTHMCIDTTTRAAFDLGFRCQLVHDACATKSLGFAGHTVAAQQVQIAYLAGLHGIFAECVSTAELLDR